MQQLLPLYVSLRTSHVSSFKQEGYFRLDKWKHIQIDPSIYEVRTMRGSGPGGQGTNSSSNKVELRVAMDRLSEFFEEDIIDALRAKEGDGGAISSDGATLVVSSHDHRSALQNKEECIDKVRRMIREASWVPPVEADPIEHKPSHVVHKSKLQRRRKSNASQMRRTARRGDW